MNKTMKILMVLMLGMVLSMPGAVWADKGDHDCAKCPAKICPLMKKDCKQKECMKCAEEKKNSLKEKFFYKAGLFLKHADEIGLSEEQVKQIKDLKHSTKKAYVMKKAEIEVAAIDFQAGLYGKVDVNAMNGIIDKKYDLKKEKAKMLVKAYADLKNILSDSQMEKIKELYKEKQGKKK